MVLYDLPNLQYSPFGPPSQQSFVLPNWSSSATSREPSRSRSSCSCSLLPIHLPARRGGRCRLISTGRSFESCPNCQSPFLDRFLNVLRYSNSLRDFLLGSAVHGVDVVIQGVRNVSPV